MIEIEKSSPQGNAYYIMKMVEVTMKNMGKDQDEIDEAWEAMKSGDYDDLCRTAEDVTQGYVIVY